MELIISTVKGIIREYFKLRNYSYHTEKNILQVLKHFGIYIRNTKKVKDLREVEEEHYYEYMEYLKNKKHLKDNTRKCYGIYLNKIFNILCEEDKILANPFIDVKPVKSKTVIRDKVLTEDEINRLLNVCDLTKPIDFRNRTIIEVLYGTGLRVSEITNLELSDFFMDEKLLLVRNGKGKKDRLIPLGDKAFKYLTEYVKRTRKKILKREENRHLFLRQSGLCLRPFHVFAILGRISKKSGIEKKVSPHVLRHTFATHLLQSGADLRHIQTLLGHKSISSTQVYINLNMKYLKKEYQKYHPLENELFFDVNDREKAVIEGKLEDSHMKVKKKFDKR